MHTENKTNTVSLSVSTWVFMAFFMLSPICAAEKMDILFIAIDDMNDWTTVFDKNNPIQTPNLQRLAARGAFFERAYCASASCNPSRTATLTGLRPSTSGVYNNPDPWGEMLPDVTTLPQVFKHNGYAAIGAGKIFTHGKAGAEQKGNPSFDAFYKLQPAGKSKLHADKPHMNYNGYPGRKRYFDWGEHDTDKQADEHTVEYVNEVMASHPREKPLFLAAGIYRPHMPFFAPPRTFEKYPINTLRMPPMPENDLADVPPLGVEMAGISLSEWNYTSQKPDDHPGSLKKMVQSYQAASDFADEMVGRLLDQLDKTGRAENTIIVLWSDHGYHLGDKTSCGKTTLWEKANHVPFIIVAPGITKPGTRIDTPVGLVDIYPTLLDLAGLPAMPDLDGQSLVPLLKNPQAKWDRPALMTQGRGNHAVRSRDWRYIRYKDGTEELYDCKTDDPWNHTNLLAGEDRDKYASVVAEHQKWLPETEAPERGPEQVRDNKQKKR